MDLNHPPFPFGDIARESSDSISMFPSKSTAGTISCTKISHNCCHIRKNHVLQKTPVSVHRFFTGHNIKRNPHTCLMFYLHQIFNQLFKNIECFRHSDIKHAFCLVKSQPGTLPSRQKNCTDFSFPECFQSRFPIQIFLLSDFGKFGRLQRRKRSSLLFFR